MPVSAEHYANDVVPSKGSRPVAVLPIAFVLLLVAINGPNILQAFVATAVLVFGVFLLWRPGEPPIFLALFAVQWLQSTLPAFQGNLAERRLDRMSEAFADLETATILSELALAFLAVGIRLGVGRYRGHYAAVARYTAASRPLRSFFILYLFAVAASFSGEFVAAAVPGLSQPLLALSNLRWSFFWMLGYATFVQRGGSSTYFLLSFAVELAWGFGGFFSDFKTVFIFAILAAAAAQTRISASRGLGLAILACMLLGLGVLWTEIKPQYRAFVNGGQASQIVTVGIGERVGKLQELISLQDLNSLSDGAEKLGERMAYIEYFGEVLNYVPAVVPHENGALWWDAVTRPFMPRIFFPDKEIIDDSARTNKYTGAGVAGADQGTSISIGYLGESYIDFGAYGMMVPIFFLGYFYGRIYRWLLTMRYSQGLLGMGLASSVMVGALFAESSITKVFGGFVVSTLMAWIIASFVVPRFCPWLLTR